VVWICALLQADYSAAIVIHNNSPIPGSTTIMEYPINDCHRPSQNPFLFTITPDSSRNIFSLLFLVMFKISYIRSRRILPAILCSFNFSVLVVHLVCFQYFICSPVYSLRRASNSSTTHWPGRWGVHQSQSTTGREKKARSTFNHIATQLPSEQHHYCAPLWKN
jgi:hypothetical protein